ncbi:substrate-binding domain-containing protein [Defluviimonas salinarum]|uniref:Substrate-binding domain-containing protein n=1 Tax=Defluviimonas salinarum TaxID=2992147 RepID=A0ABT3J7W7_9RHOB|nr:substrate-binding domain-containing protein [Defluviimonas salinarum]MCW3783781.1 substrate-binding domain-containing protein [Defluviimonas salinarum]
MTFKTAIAAISALWLATAAGAEELKMAVTTSFANSGLAEILLPEIEKDTGITVELLVVGTGQALKLGEAGDVDAVLVHSKAAEEEFVAAGHATHRREIMYNDFVVVGPAADPAGVKAATAATEAFAGIAAAQAPFVSRGDDSGTHKAELKLWKAAGIEPAGDWYKAVGQGMGAALNTAAGMDAYILSDRASWLNFENKANLGLLFEGDKALFNQYAYLPVNPEKHAHVKADAAKALEDWLTSDKAKGMIEGYKIGDQQLFHFNAEAM